MAKAFFLNTSPRDQLGKLIEDVSNSGCKQLKESDLKEFKNLCKKGDNDLIEFVYRIFILQLEKNHCQKRYSTMLLIEQLFKRSHHFRSIFTDQTNLNYFFELTLGCTNKDKPLPKPKVYAKLLKEKIHQLVKEWIREFSKGYPSLEQVYKMALASLSENENNLNNDDNNNNMNNNSESINQSTLREIHLIERIDRKLEEYNILENELPDQINQIRNCFELIIPKDEFRLDQINNSNDNCEIESRLMATNNFTNFNKKEIAITLKPYLEIRINDNNRDTIEIVREFYKQLVNDYLPKIKNLLKHLQKIKRCEREVKKLIEFKNQVLELISMYTELKFINDNLNEDQNNSIDNEFNENHENNESSTDDDDFEEVEEKDVEWEIPPERWSEYGITEPFVNKYNDNPDQPSTSGLNNLIDFDPEACNVKMENGNLCKRKDKRRCPFHGPIQPRDSEGNLIDIRQRKQEENENKKREEDWQDPKYLKELENQIGIDLTIKKIKVKKNPELLNLKTCDETPKSRLLKKMKTLKRG